MKKNILRHLGLLCSIGVSDGEYGLADDLSDGLTAALRGDVE